MPRTIFRAVLVLASLVLVGCATVSQGPSSSNDCQRIAEDNRQLREALGNAMRTIEEEQNTIRSLDRSLKTTVQEIVKLRDEVLLYRDILVPPDRKGGLRIQMLEIQPTGASNLYNYKLLLIQSMKHETTILGTATFQIVGLKDGQESALTFPTNGERGIQVKLRYFQEIEGKFELPRGFHPRTVKVRVAGQGGGQNVERVFEWPRV